MDSESDINPYDRITIIVDSHELTARPTEFMYDKDGNVQHATHYETTCPYCGNLIAFQIEQLRPDRRLGCPECKRGYNQNDYTQAVVDPTRSNVIVKKSGQQVERQAPHQVSDECPFSDPIEAGLFSNKAFLETKEA